MKRAWMIILVCFIWASSARAAAPPLKVYVFLSETCPICKSITKELKALDALYGNDQVQFIGIFPSQSLSSSKSRQEFARKFKLDFTLQWDSAQVLTRQFSASVTPEVVVYREESNEILYRGLIDNSYVLVGKRRGVTTEFYLRNVLSAVLSGTNNAFPATQPVGCLIQLQQTGLSYEK